MNKIILMGRLTADPELDKVGMDLSRAKFSIAVDRNTKDEEGKKETDFFNCVSFRGTAENISKYFKKGNKILVVGSVQIRNYEDKNKVKRQSTDVIVNEFDFVESSKDNANTRTKPTLTDVPDPNSDIPF